MGGGAAWRYKKEPQTAESIYDALFEELVIPAAVSGDQLGAREDAEAALIRRILTVRRRPWDLQARAAAFACRSILFRSASLLLFGPVTGAVSTCHFLAEAPLQYIATNLTIECMARAGAAPRIRVVGEHPQSPVSVPTCSPFART